MNRFDKKGSAQFFGRDGFGRKFSKDNRRGGERSERQMYKATCSNCGRECEVPFNPTSGKPVYCNDCFANLRGGGDKREQRGRGFGNRDRGPKRGGDEGNKRILESINQKLDRLIFLLQPKDSKEKPVYVKVETPSVTQNETVTVEAGEVENTSVVEEKPKEKKTTRKRSPKKSEEQTN